MPSGPPLGGLRCKVARGDPFTPPHCRAILDRSRSVRHLAGEQVIVLRRLERDRKNENDRLGVVLRLSPDMQRDVVRMHREVLGIGLGDNVVFEAGGKPVRIAVTDATVHLLDKDVLFRISGRRYRKDGLLGKRDEALTLGVENDAVPKQAGNTPPYSPAPATGRPAQSPFWLHR